MSLFDHERDPRFLVLMADSVPFGHYLQSPYYSPQHIIPDPAHVVPPPPQPRKRPKYTRSKTGCLTCRVKKIKCDETKPNCMRCTHGQRDCTWPEGVPTRKKITARKESANTAEGRPSTASSSASSTPPMRNPSPPRRLATTDLGLLQMNPRRSFDPYLQLHPLPAEPDLTRRTHLPNDRSLYLHPTPTNASNVMNMMPETTSYRYDQYAYPNTVPPLQSSRHPLSAGLRPMNHHQHINHWASPESIDPYFPAMPERTLVGHTPISDNHTRY